MNADLWVGYCHLGVKVGTHKNVYVPMDDGPRYRNLHHIHT
jgi:hypothetical protein